LSIRVFKNRISFSALYLILMAVPLSIYAYIFLPYYTGGDQIYYRYLYAVFADTAFGDVMYVSKTVVGGAEPISLYVLWVGAFLGFEKNIYIAFLNLLLLFGLLLFLRRYRSGIFPLLLMMSNYYVLVLMTSAERLKIGYILLVWSVVVGGRLGNVIFMLSPLAHFQNLILFPSLYLMRFSNSVERFFARYVIRISNVTFVVFVAFILLFVVVFFLRDPIVHKAAIYIANAGGMSEMYNLVLLALVAVFVAKDRFRMVLTLLPIFFAVFLFGGDRVNMIAVTLVFYVFTVDGRLRNPLVVFLMLYFSLKGMFYIQNVVLYGDGFL